MVEERELVRLWLEQRYTAQGFNVQRLAAKLRVSHSAVGHWLRGRTSIHPRYWWRITRFFGFSDTEAMLAEARALQDRRGV